MKVHTEISGVDGQMVGLLQGDKGGKCHYCPAGRDSCNSLIDIIQGFTIIKSFEECKRVWDELDRGRMQWGDVERGGQCHEPIVGCRFFSVLHKELRSFDFIQKVYYRLIAGIYDWADGKNHRNKTC